MSQKPDGGSTSRSLIRRVDADGTPVLKPISGFWNFEHRLDLAGSDSRCFRLISFTGFLEVTALASWGLHFVSIDQLSL